MDKSWIIKDRLSKEYEEGVGEFIKLALENATDPSRVHCPCRKCSNLKKKIRYYGDKESSIL